MVLSFRAEYAGDAQEFLRRLELSLPDTSAEYRVRIHRNKVVGISEPLVEVVSDTISSNHVIKVLNDMPDSHVCLDTLRLCPIEENLFKREYGANRL